MEGFSVCACANLISDFFHVKSTLNKLKYCSKFSNLTASRKQDGFMREAAVAQSGRAADSERFEPFEAEAVNQLVVGSNPTGGANTIVYVDPRL